MYVSMRVSLGGGRVAWWAWDSRNGSRCAWVCVYVDSFLRQVEAAALFAEPLFMSERVLSEKCEPIRRGKVRRSTGVKWTLKFQWQSGRNSPELSPHMSCNLADISRLLQPRSGFRDIYFLVVSCCIKIYYKPFSYQLHPDHSGLFHTLESSQQRWLCKHLLLTWIFYSISITT